MKKVMCIKSFKTSSQFRHVPEPFVGDKDVVSFERIYNGKVWYSLERFGEDCGYDARNFATLPDTSEELEIEAKKEAIIM